MNLINKRYKDLIQEVGALALRIRNPRLQMLATKQTKFHEPRITDVERYSRNGNEGSLGVPVKESQILGSFVQKRGDRINEQ